MVRIGWLDRCSKQTVDNRHGLPACKPTENAGRDSDGEEGRLTLHDVIATSCEVPNSFCWSLCRFARSWGVKDANELHLVHVVSPWG